MKKFYISLWVKCIDIDKFHNIIEGENLTISLFNDKPINYDMFQVQVTYYQYQLIKHLIIKI